MSAKRALLTEAGHEQPLAGAFLNAYNSVPSERSSKLASMLDNLIDQSGSSGEGTRRDARS